MGCTITQGWSCLPSGFGGGNALSACHDVNSGGWLHIHCGAETAKWGENLSDVPHHAAWNLLQVSAPGMLLSSIFSANAQFSKMDGVFVLSRYIQENRVACEIGLYYVLHIAKQRNKNALQRLLPALGETPVRDFGLMDPLVKASQTLITLCVCLCSWYL